MRYYVSATLRPLVRAASPMRFPLPRYSAAPTFADDLPSPSLPIVDRMTFRHEAEVPDSPYGMEEAREARVLVAAELERRLDPLLDLMLRSTPDVPTASRRYRLAVDVDGRHAMAETTVAESIVTADPGAETAVRRQLLAELCRVIAAELELIRVP